MSLKALNETDLDLALCWEKDPVLLQAIHTHDEISLEECRARFQRAQNDLGICCFAWHDTAATLQGVLYFNRIDVKQKKANWGFYTNPAATSDVTMRMAVDALDMAFGKLALQKLSAEALATNSRSIAFLKKVGFTEEGRFREQYFDGERRVDVIRFGMLASEWAAYRVRLQTFIAKCDTLASCSPSLYSRKITILTDADSWINAELDDLIMEWEKHGHSLHWAHQTTDLPIADFCFCLSFGQLLPKEVRARFRHTLVVHESDLPHGKGWSPLTWQILEGKSRIPVTLFEAADLVDSGCIYAQSWIELEGHELVEELRAAQSAATRTLCRWFVENYPNSIALSREQTGKESRYPRRKPADSALDPEKTIAEQFNLLRVVDNQRYPAFFELHGHRYNLTINRTPQ